MWTKIKPKPSYSLFKAQMAQMASTSFSMSSPDERMPKLAGESPSDICQLTPSIMLGSRHLSKCLNSKMIRITLSLPGSHKPFFTQLRKLVHNFSRLGAVHVSSSSCLSHTCLFVSSTCAALQWALEGQRCVSMCLKAKSV